MSVFLTPFTLALFCLPQVCELAMAKGESFESVLSRLMCCRLLSKIVLKLARPALTVADQSPIVQSPSGILGADRPVISAILEKAIALCSDADAEVRVCICEEMEPIARTAGSGGRVILAERVFL